jgi:hypothetical protein
MVLERLEAELLGDHIPGADMPTSPISRFPDATISPLSSQHPTLCGGHAIVGCVPQTLPPIPTPLLHRSRENKLEVYRSMRKA